MGISAPAQANRIPQSVIISLNHPELRLRLNGERAVLADDPPAHDRQLSQSQKKEKSIFSSDTGLTKRG
jgi:hypothetical protein